jgi:ubiquinone/menaquinone biosynthesis C-methylase UbiE
MAKFVTPEKILNQLGLSGGMTAVDLGCGSGGWTIPLAKMLPEGKVFALDLLKSSLSALESKARIERIFNIQTVVADVEKKTPISQASSDAVLMTNLLFEVENKKAVLEEGKRILKPGGKILVVDWKKSANFGPRERAVLPEEIKKIAQEAGFLVKEEFEAGDYHYGIILEKTG